ncbi:hypothetical protein PspCFBP13528_23040 [Pseudomonas sp. CFBP13528]|uniref:hypothetical protein n=1 Tax=Pseudomonas sp. CFBP13528 TaxID=2184006 RepID=UPI0010C0B956|nr:hypothetical protein [Pseudomonas sp. CFBP13528]TKK27116.1 hypothetical protein PspCFBP13528_23040 [Pseudomonas sp. CFBP13528]
MDSNEESSPSGQHLTDNSEQQSLPAPIPRAQEKRKKAPSARRSHIDTSYLVPPPSDATLNLIKAGERVPLSDLTLYIPARTLGVQGVDAGINRIAVMSQEEGVLFALLPFLEAAELDDVECFWGTLKNPVAHTTIQKQHLDGHQLIVMFVPRPVISDGLVYAYIKVTRLGQAVGETKRTLLKVDTRQPGGENPASPHPVNPNLRKPVIDPKYLRDGITETDFSNGKCIAVGIPSYPADTSLPPPDHRAVRDVIHLKIGDHTIKRTVLPEEAGTYQDIVIEVCQSDWLKIGNGSHPCLFSVEDEVGNPSDGWSEAEYLQVYLDDGSRDLLPACHFLEADDDGTLDLSKVTGAQVTILVLIEPRNYAINDVIRVRLSGTAAGLPVSKIYNSAPLQSTASRLLRIPCPVIDLEPLVGGRSFLQYERIRYNEKNLGSFITEVYVTGSASGGLRAPEVREAVNGRIPADLTQAHVDIEVHGFGYYDQVELHVLGKSPGHSYYDNTVDKIGSGKVSFELIRGLGVPIALLMGGSLEIWYFTITADDRHRSPITTVYIDARYAALPAPDVDEAPPPAYEFDLGTSERANIWVPANPDIKDGDTVILHARGDAPGGTAPSQPLPIDIFWEGRDLPFKVELDFIRPNKQMDISYERVRPNAATRASEIVPMKIIIEHDLPAPLVYNSTPLDDENATIDPKMADSTPNVTIRVQFAMSEKDLIKPELTGRPGIALPTIEPQYGNPRVGYVLFVFPNWVLAYHLKSVLRIQYHVTNNGSTRDSRVLNLRVLGFDEIPGGNPLPQPTLNSLKPGSLLDLNTVSTNYCWVDLARWLLSRKDQPIWLKCHSTDASRPLTLLNGDLISQEQAEHGIIREPADLGWFTALPDGSTVKVTAAVGYTGSKTEADATLFPSSTYLIKALRLSDFTDFEVFFWNGWANLVNGLGEIRNFNNNNYWHAKLNGASAITPGVIKTFFIKSGRTYRISFKMKVDLSPYQPLTYVEFGSQSENFVYIHEGKWHTYDLSFSLPAGAPSQYLPIRIYFKSTYSPAEFSLDDILVAELP